MTRKLFGIVLLSLLLMLLVTACSPEPEPETVVSDRYWAYYQACQESKWGTASDFLSADGRLLAEQIGICGFVHDSINLLEMARGGPQHSFLDDPDVGVNEDAAQMIWVDDYGFLTVVFFVKVDGVWLINEIKYST